MRAMLSLLALLTAGVAAPVATPVAAQSTAASASPVIPNFFDPQVRIPRPDLSGRERLRFLTVTDFPPFSFIGTGDRLTGFHVDLAREICRELGLLARCQIQAVPFAELEGELAAGGGEAILAGIAQNESTRRRLGFSEPYFRLPARFVAPVADTFTPPAISGLAGQDVGVIDGSAHAAFARARFEDMRVRLYETRERALEALDKGEIAALFDDALALSFIIRDREVQGSTRQPLTFVDGPYLDAVYLDRSLAVAVDVADDELSAGIDYALRRIGESGKFAELYLRYFPVGLF